MDRYFINLTNGIEFYPDIADLSNFAGYIRIQSTACEQKLWSKIILDLDYTFLMYLALGKDDVYVYDCGANKLQSRALYQGLPFIGYTLQRCWYNIIATKVFVRTNNVYKYFDEVYTQLDEQAIKKLKYFVPFLNTTNKSIRLYDTYKSTSHDGNKEYFKQILYGEI